MIYLSHFIECQLKKHTLIEKLIQELEAKKKTSGGSITDVPVKDDAATKEHVRKLTIHTYVRCMQ